MALPRSVNGFEKAISEAEAAISEIDQNLQEAEANSSEEEDLLADKAEKSIELEQLKLKFEEFKVSEQAKADEGKEGSEDQETKPEPEEEKWPEIIYVKVRNDLGFMVNPYTHFRHTEGFQKVVVDNWTISQIKAGILIVDKD